MNILCYIIHQGEVTEWLIVRTWNVREGLRLPGVRIPPSPCAELLDTMSSEEDNL